MSFTAINVVEPDVAPTLFRGARFWLSQTVPQRQRFKEQIQRHGGIPVLMESDADVKLVDHTRKNLPSDVYSYQYVERSIQKGQLEDLEAHRAGPSGHRPMGATNIPTKGKRSFFTLKEDQLVFDWICHLAKEPGAPVQGNLFYQDLAELFPVHPWQSWRSRYTKHLLGKSRPGGGVPVSLEEIIQSAPFRPPQGKFLKLLNNSKSPQEPPANPASRPLPPAPPAPAQDKGADTSKRKRDSIPQPSVQVVLPPLKKRAIEPSAPKSSVSSHSQLPTHEQSHLPPLTAPSATEPHPQAPAITAPPASASSASSSSKLLAGLGIPELFPSERTRTENPSRVSRDPPHGAEKKTDRSAPPGQSLEGNAKTKPGQVEEEPTNKANDRPDPSPKKDQPAGPKPRANPVQSTQKEPPTRPLGDNAFAKSRQTKNQEQIGRLQSMRSPEKLAQKAHVRPLGDNAFAQSGRFKKTDPKPRPPVNDPFQGPTDPIFTELPFLPPSSGSVVSEDDGDEIPDVDGWIDERLARGANESHVLEALCCTSMVPELADKVLKHLAAGKGIPNNMRGVWTAEDDRCLQAEQHSEVQRALSKHGADAYKDRWDYLRMARNEGLNS